MGPDRIHPRILREHRRYWQHLAGDRSGYRGLEKRRAEVVPLHKRGRRQEANVWSSEPDLSGGEINPRTYEESWNILKPQGYMIHTAGFQQGEVMSD